MDGHFPVALDEKSGVNREVHAPFCGSPGVRFPRATRLKKDKDNEAVAAGEAPLTPAERTRIRELEADVRRLNMENAFLKKASAYFASQNL